MVGRLPIALIDSRQLSRKEILYHVHPPRSLGGVQDWHSNCSAPWVYFFVHALLLAIASLSSTCVSVARHHTYNKQLPWLQYSRVDGSSRRRTHLPSFFRTPVFCFTCVSNWSLRGCLTSIEPVGWTLSTYFVTKFTKVGLKKLFCTNDIWTPQFSEPDTTIRLNK